MLRAEERLISRGDWKNSRCRGAGGLEGGQRSARKIPLGEDTHAVAEEVAGWLRSDES